jgi:hypothetical protein
MPQESHLFSESVYRAGMSNLLVHVLSVLRAARRGDHNRKIF